MAALSDDLWLVTVLAYLAAMVAYAVEYVFVSRPARTRAFSLSLRGAPLVSVGADAGRAAEDSPPSGPPAAATSPVSAGPTGEQGTDPVTGGAGWRGLSPLSWLALALLSVAALAHLATTVTRGLAAERMPWGNMYEYALSATLVAVAVWFVVLYRHPAVRHLSLYVALANAVLLGLAGVVAYTPVEPLMPALDSHWFLIHVSAYVVASGLFLVGFISVTMFLVRRGHDAGRRRFPYPLGARMPGAAALERLSFRMHAIAFPIWTFATAAGAIWAEASWGRYWGWDPKEVWAFITWVVYAAYLHARATPSVKRNVVAWLAIIGWLTVMMNLFGVNLFFESLHSYA